MHVSGGTGRPAAKCRANQGWYEPNEEERNDNDAEAERIADTRELPLDGGELFQDLILVFHTYKY